MTSFTERFGFAAEGTWSAPGRVNLIGEHTDYNGGLCLPIALPQRTSAQVRRREDRLLRMWSDQEEHLVEVAIDDVAPGHPEGWAAYAAGVVWALDQAGYEVGGLDISIDGQVPVGGGLSSSAALECSVGAAVSDVFALDLMTSDYSRAELAQLCVKAENDIAKAPTGGMDQSAALRCTPAHALLLDCRDGSVEQVPFDLALSGLALLVMDTRAVHSLVDGQYAARRHSCEEGVAALGVTSLREVGVADLDAALGRLDDPVVRRRVRHVVTEIDRVRQFVAALHEGRVSDVGPIMDASHVSLRDDYEVSCAELDVAVETARAAGAFGARMTGGGFGGSAIALVTAGTEDAVTEAVVAAFAEHGFRPPHCFAVVASGPASRDSWGQPPNA